MVGEKEAAHSQTSALEVSSHVMSPMPHEAAEVDGEEHDNVVEMATENAVQSARQEEKVVIISGSRKLLPSITNLINFSSAQNCVRCRQNIRLSAFCIGVDVSLSNNTETKFTKICRKLQRSQFDFSLYFFELKATRSTDLRLNICRW